MTWLQWLVGDAMGVAIMGQLFFSQLMQDGGSEAAASTPPMPPRSNGPYTTLSSPLR